MPELKYIVANVNRYVMYRYIKAAITLQLKGFTADTGNISVTLVQKTKIQAASYICIVIPDSQIWHM